MRRHTGKCARALFHCIMATLRQYVSLAICVSVIFSIILLTILSPHGQWRIPDDLVNNSPDGKTEGKHSQARERQPLAGYQAKSGGDGGTRFRAYMRIQQGTEAPDECQKDEVPLTFTPEELALADIKPPNVIRKPRIWEKKDSATQAKIDALLKSRNLCWRNEKRAGSLACVPYYYLAGFPKCGTTDLFRRLTSHPDIIRDSRKRKEMHWLTRSRFRSPFGLTEALETYTVFWGKTMLTSNNTFKRNTSNVIIGDNSASTIWDNGQWRQIPANQNCSQPRVITADVVRHLNPHAKIIIIVRNPTDRLYSEYLFFHDNSTKEFFHTEATRAVKQAIRCLRRNSIHRCVYVELNDLSPRIHLGLYHVYIADWLRRFPRDQFHVIRLDDLAADRQKVLLEAYAFLGVEAPDEATLKAIVKQRVIRAGTRVKTEGSMLMKTRRLLDDFYRPFNAELARLLNDTKYDWTNETRTEDRENVRGDRVGG